jgi:predicted flap endonuclease-1-like 5' DNA nuclease
MTEKKVLKKLEDIKGIGPKSIQYLNNINIFDNFKLNII